MATRGPVEARWWSRWLCAVAVLVVVTGATPAAAAQAEDDATVRMARPTWDTGWFQAEIYRQLLVELGYDVTGPVTMDNDEFYRAVAAGEVDFWASGWFPLHEQYLRDDQTRNAVDIVGTQVEAGAFQGYLMDLATAEAEGITSLGALRDPQLAKRFDIDGDDKADLIGCNVEWACADIIDHHLRVYGLTNTVEHIQADYSLLMTEVIERHAAGEPVVFYTFTPNWTVGELVPGEDVRWLETPFASRPGGFGGVSSSTSIADLDGCPSDPCQTGWAVNDIRIVANSPFLQEHPAAARLLEAVEIPLDDILDQNARMVSGEGDIADIERHAQTWIERNAGVVADWLEQADPSTVRGADSAQQGTDGAVTPQTLRVAARAFAPFVIYENRTFGGFTVELVELVAGELGVEYELYGVNSVAKQLDDVRRGAADLAVAGLSITSSRERDVDFSHSIFDTGLQVMVPAESGGGVLDQLGHVLVGRNVVWFVLFFFATLVVSSHVIWWLERRRNPQFDTSYRRGLWDSFWWSTVTVTTVGYGDKAPTGAWGRGWALFWMVAGYLVFAMFTASITSALAVEEIRGAINGPDDLLGNRVVTVAGTSAEQYLERQGVGPMTVATIDEAHAELEAGNADALVFDAPVLQYHAAHQGQGEVRIVGPVFERVRYGAAVAADSPLRERINVALLEVIESGAYDRLHDEWFGATGIGDG